MTREPSPALSFVIPVKNDPIRLARCLASIRESAPASVPVEIMVADNGSTDNTVDVAKKHGATVLVLPGLRVSQLRNRAAAAATGHVLAFVDADHELDRGWVPAAIASVDESGVAGAGAIYTAPQTGTWVQRAYGALRGRTVGRRTTAWLGSGNLAIRREAFAAVGGFDETLEACEDVDLCQRLARAGWRLMADERLRSVHLGDPATLGALFRAERWRGRNNIQVSLRGPWQWRNLPSVAIPIVDLAAIAVAAVGLVFTPWLGLIGRASVAVSLALVAAFATLRVARSLASGHVSWAQIPQAYCVSLTHDVARALALVTRAPHHRRPPAQPARVTAP